MAERQRKTAGLAASAARGVPIEAHGLIGNMRTTALVSTEASIDFMCFPRIDSPTLFASLLDAKRGGAFSITPAFDAPHAKQMYLPETNVLLTRFMSADAVCEIIDFMPVSSDDDDLENASNCVIRIVRAIYGTCRWHCAARRVSTTRASATTRSAKVPAASGSSRIPGKRKRSRSRSTQASRSRWKMAMRSRASN
jgi:GH15 family glucan-1,4-alpha-glucosidase